MTNKWDVAMGVWLMSVLLLGSGYYLYQSERRLTSPIVEVAVERKPVVMEKPVIVPPKEVGQPSTGTTHIKQSIIPETANPYSMNDVESVNNFNASVEGQFLQALFEKLNSPSSTIITQQLVNLEGTDLSNAIQISPAFQQMLYGYRPIDNPKHFLYVTDYMREYQPHAALLYYVQSVRSEETYRARMLGSVLPQVTKGTTSKINITLQNQEIAYLVRQSAGTCLIESIGPEIKHFEVSFLFTIGIPRTESFPLLLWPGKTQITLKPIDLSTWEVAKKAYFVRG